MAFSGETAFTVPDGTTSHQVDAWQPGPSSATEGGRQIRVVGATAAEAWRPAVGAAAAVGMLANWPRPAR
jgi:hypothetical protein